MGTPHDHYYSALTTDPADANWHELDLSAQTPVGAKRVFVQCTVYGASANRTLSISNANAGNVYVYATTPAATCNGRGSGPVLLSATRTIWWQVSNADVSQINITMVDYDC
jgi:hypothetical protein